MMALVHMALSLWLNAFLFELKSLICSVNVNLIRIQAVAKTILPDLQPCLYLNHEPWLGVLEYEVLISMTIAIC